MIADYSGQHWLGQDPHMVESPSSIERLEELIMRARRRGGARRAGFLAMTDVLADRLPSAERVMVPDVGHMVNMEQPATVSALLIRFLRKNCA